jgi:hypothetical protein
MKTKKKEKRYFKNRTLGIGIGMHQKGMEIAIKMVECGFSPDKAIEINRLSDVYSDSISKYMYDFQALHGGISWGEHTHALNVSREMVKGNHSFELITTVTGIPVEELMIMSLRNDKASKYSGNTV